MDFARLDRLLDRYLDEALSFDERSEFEQMLRSSAQARQTFWERARFHALLREAGAEGRGRELAVEPRPRRRSLAAKFGALWSDAGWLVAAAALIVALAGIWLAYEKIDSRGDQTTSAVAVLAQAVEVEWMGGGEPYSVGAALSPGWLRLKSGLAQIEFNDGARLIVEGPAELEIRSRGETYCREGRFSVQVPSAAQGFKIASPRLTIVGLGAAFGFQAHLGAAEVHVFEGRVQLTDALNPPTRELIAGQALGVDADSVWKEAAAMPSLFPNVAALEQKAASSWERRAADWKKTTGALRGDSTAILHFTFEGGGPFERQLPNAASGEPRVSDGAIVGCRWVEGRWPGKGALEFKGTGDCVRLEVPGVFDALTLAAWVRVDSLDHTYSSLLMADAFDRGGIHWQITKGGALRLGISGGGDFDSPPVFSPERFGQWVHLAVVVDRAARCVTHYVDGQPMSTRELRIEVPLGFGRAELGNWNPGPHHDRTAIRNFNGRMDEVVIFCRALSAEEVRNLFQNRTPHSLTSP
jgi:ferric-dicitrate binding protein FerR (iron transport regulator)